jgi:hypothetical protein
MTIIIANGKDLHTLQGAIFFLSLKGYPEQSLYQWPQSPSVTMIPFREKDQRIMFIM